MALTGRSQPLRLCALLACHNRRAQTLACLQALQDSATRAGFAPAAVLVDDGSRDGTAAAVREAFPWVQVLEADGTLYWCRAMHRAFAHALQRGGDADAAYLWLNDDTQLQVDALLRLHATAETLQKQHGPAQILVGTVAQDGRPSYGGRVRHAVQRRFGWRLLEPLAQAQPIDTFDGNLVWISAAAAECTGNLDAAFEHAMGDTDYGLRARAAGVGLWLAPGLYGQCALNPVAGSFNDATLSRRERWRALLARKGLPWRSWWRFTRRHAGWLWPLYFAWPYARVLLGLRARDA